MAKMADQLRTNHVMAMSHDVIVPFCGLQKKQSRTFHISSRFHRHSFNAIEVMP